MAMPDPSIQNAAVMRAQDDAARVVVTGASGLVGTALCTLLRTRGHHVDRLVRRPARPEAGEIRWDPAHGSIDAASLEGTDLVVNLAGESIAAGRWTPARKRAILESRTQGTRLLCETLARLDRRPQALVSASAVGYYGDRGEEWVTEESAAGAGFLADVCKQWEAATLPAREAGIRVVNLRIGVVLSTAGGALARMLPTFRFGLGGRLGAGRQYMSWITLDDLVAAIEHLLFASQTAGPVNAVAPNPVTNAQFTKTLGRILRRPTFLSMPAFAVRLALGEMGEAVLLSGVRAKPARLLADGFSFRDHELEPALRGMLRQ